MINIVKAENRPMPYILFGPPGILIIMTNVLYKIFNLSFYFYHSLSGTGKTHTIVAAVVEILRSSKKNCVLICANTNTACEELTLRLAKVLQAGELFRLYAKSYDSLKIKDQIKPMCNWSDGQYHFPSLKFLYRYRVIICTMAASGYLNMVCNDRSFDPAHFSHVFIDECANSHETVSLIPIAGRNYCFFFQCIAF